MSNYINKLTLKSLGIDTHQEHAVYLRGDCPICASEGFSPSTRLVVSNRTHSVVATLNLVQTDLLKDGEASLSTQAWRALEACEGETVEINTLRPFESFREVRAKMFGKRLSKKDLKAILKDIIHGRYSNIHLAAFITSYIGNSLDDDEITGLTEAMIEVGESINWEKEVVADIHCVGRLPGNRTTPIVVAIAAAAGLTIPSTSSSAIILPARTTDTMEVMAPVRLSIDEIRAVVDKEGGCIVWGGGMKLSPADDILIGIERALNVDGDGQMIASVLSKKAAAGATHVIIDIPVGLTAKVYTLMDAQRLKRCFLAVAKKIGLTVNVVLTDGTQPVGRGIGPSLEARDVLAVLRNEPDAPNDLKERALFLAGQLLEVTGRISFGKGLEVATHLLGSGNAWRKFYAICEAQGGFREPEIAPFKEEIHALKSGEVTKIDNHRLAKIAKLAGAPHHPLSGIDLHTSVGTSVRKGSPLFTIHAQTEGGITYAKTYHLEEKDIISIQS